jgi:hypothetical protein
MVNLLVLADGRRWRIPPHSALIQPIPEDTDEAGRRE